MHDQAAEEVPMLIASGQLLGLTVPAVSMCSSSLQIFILNLEDIGKIGPDE